MKWVEKTAYAALGLSDDLPENEYLEVGEFRVIDSPEMLFFVTEKVLETLKEKRDLVHRFAPSQAHRLPYIQDPDSFFLSYAEHTQKPGKPTPYDSGFVSAYVAYLEKTLPALASFFFTRLKFRIPESARERHTYIVGGSGSGKSELLKVLMYPYIKPKHRTATVVLFDPHGDIAAQVGHWKEHIPGNNLIYIDPSLKTGFMPCINPLDIPHNASDQFVNNMAECLTEVFKEIVGAESNITANMGTMLKAVLTILLKKPGATLKDLQIFMKDEENESLVEYAIAHSPPGQRHFFESSFYDKNYQPTKRALYTKLQDLFNSQVFYDLTVGKSTLSIRELMDSKKTVVFSLPKGVVGEQTSSAFGRFMLALMQGFAFQRQDIPKSERVKTHVFLDEFHNFVTPSIAVILDEARKYALHLTLVQQFYGQKTNNLLKGSIMTNTAIKITGTGEGESLQKLSKLMTGTSADDIQNLAMGEFYIKMKRQNGLIQQAFHSNNAKKFINNITLLDFRNSMKAEQWQQVRQYQLEHYYRDLALERDSDENAPETIVGINPENITPSTEKTPQNAKSEAYKPLFDL